MDDKKRNLCLKTKYDIVMNRKAGMSVDEIVVKHNLKRKSHVHNLMKKAATIKTQYENGRNPNKKSLKGSSIPQLDDHIKNFIRSKTSRGVPISRRIIATEVKLTARKKYGKDLKGSDGYITNLMKRIDGSVKKTHGEANAVDEQLVKDWKEKLPALLRNYSPKDVYNMDELGLYFDLLPSASYVIGTDRLRATKNSKRRLTVLLGANADGSDKLVPLVIGKSKKPRCYKEKKVKKPPVNYSSNKTAWMTADIFPEYLSNWNSKLRKEGRNVLLFYDGCSSHPVKPTLSNIKAITFPPNATSVLQPMDAGVIKCFKNYYRNRVVLHIVTILKSNEKSTLKDVKIDVLDAMGWIKNSWINMEDKTIANCFRKCGFFVDKESVQETEAETAQESEEFTLLKGTLNEVSNFEQFVSADDQLPTSDFFDLSISDEPEEIEEDGDEEEESGIEEVPLVKLSVSEILGHVAAIRTFINFENDQFSQFSSELEQFGRNVLLDSERKKKQTKIDDYFVTKCSN